MLWLDGRLHEGPHAPFDLTDRGLTLGDGVFDTALALNGRIVFEAEHRDRLAAAAAALGIPVAPEAIGEAMRALAATGGRLAIRTTLTRGSGPRGLKPPADPEPRLFAVAAPAPSGSTFRPLSLWPAGIARNDTSPAARLKTLGYLDAVLSAREAAANSCDEALFRNTRGRIACAGTGNLFALIDGRLVTPPVSEGVLPGIVRGRLLALATACGLAAIEEPLTAERFARAEAVYLTNSLRLLAPVEAIGGRAVASAAHPATKTLRAVLTAAVAESCSVPPEAVA